MSWPGFGITLKELRYPHALEWGACLERGGMDGKDPEDSGKQQVGGRFKILKFRSEFHLNLIFGT